MTTVTHPRRQLSRPRPAAAPEGPVDMTVMYLMHHAFRRDLHAFSETVPRTPVEDRDAWRALGQRWEHFAAVLHHHHTGEDTYLWPFLMGRATEEERGTLAAMEAEHAEIDPGLAACAAGFARLADHADVDARAGLAVRLCAVREALGRHLRHEESETIALLQRVMTQEEWEEVDKGFAKGISFPFLLRTIPWVMHQVPFEAREHVFAASGVAHRVLWRLTRPRFERLQARAFRYAP